MFILILLQFNVDFSLEIFFGVFVDAFYTFFQCD